MDFEFAPPRAEYAEVFFGLRQQPSTLRFNPVEPLTLEQVRENLTNAAVTLSDLKERTAYRWFVHHGGELIGSVSLSGVSLRMGLGEIGYMLAESHQGRGLGQAMVRRWIEHIFSETPLRKLIAYVDEGNLPSVRILEKIAFVREGFLREHYVFNGKIVNEYLFGLLRREFLQN